MFFVLVLISFETTIVPEWRIQVLDVNGKAVPQTKVRQIWNDYSFDFSALEDSEETLITDNSGFVTFQERKVRASLLKRSVAKILDLLKIGIPHTSFGVHVMILCIEYNCNSIIYSGQGELSKILTVKDTGKK